MHFDNVFCDLDRWSNGLLSVISVVCTYFSNDELSNIQTWATRNDLNLNYSKSKEIVFCARVARRSSEQFSQPCQTVDRVDKLTVLGVTINARLTATNHVSGSIGMLYCNSAVGSSHPRNFAADFCDAVRHYAYLLNINVLRSHAFSDCLWSVCNQYL